MSCESIFNSLQEGTIVIGMRLVYLLVGVGSQVLQSMSHVWQTLLECTDNVSLLTITHAQVAVYSTVLPSNQISCRHTFTRKIHSLNAPLIITPALTRTWNCSPYYATYSRLCKTVRHLHCWCMSLTYIPLYEFFVILNDFANFCRWMNYNLSQSVAFGLQPVVAKI